MASDLFRRSEVATVAGMAGTLGNAGLLIFSLLIGWLVARIGYSPFFVCLGILDLIGAVVLWTVVRAPQICQPRSHEHHQPHPPRLQSRPLHLPRRRRLLHRHLHLRMVSPASRSTTRATGPLATAHPPPPPPSPNSTCAAIPIPAASGRRASATLTASSTSSTPTSNATAAPPSAASPSLAPRLPQLPRHQSDRIDGDWSDPVYLNSQRLRSVAVSRRRRPQIPPQHALGPPPRPESLRRNRASGIFAHRSKADRAAAT